MELIDDQIIFTTDSHEVIHWYHAMGVFIESLSAKKSNQEPENKMTFGGESQEKDLMIKKGERETDGEESFRLSRKELVIKKVALAQQEINWFGHKRQVSPRYVAILIDVIEPEDPAQLILCVAQTDLWQPNQELLWRRNQRKLFSDMSWTLIPGPKDIWP